MDFSLPIKSIYAVEVSGACNLEAVCAWCPMHNRPRSRKRGLMSDETVKRALYFVEQLNVKNRIPNTLMLHNFGEPLLHPKFDSIALQFSKLAPISMSTNALLLDEAWADRLARVNWDHISLSPWDDKARGRAATLLIERKIKLTYPQGVSHNWAGQAVEGPAVKLFKGCHYLNEQKCVIRWDGTITTCCITDREQDTIGDISMSPETIKVRDYSICQTCHHAV